MTAGGSGAARAAAIAGALLAHLFTLARCQTRIVTENFNCLSSGCCDHHQFCQFWADSNQCVDNADWMRPNCRIACGRCDDANVAGVDDDALMPPPASLPLVELEETKSDNKPRDVRQAGCVDMDRFQCPIWASRGECRINPRWMLPNCAISCGTCEMQMQLRRNDAARRQQQQQQQQQQQRLRQQQLQQQQFQQQQQQQQLQQQQPAQQQQTGDAECPFIVARETLQLRRRFDVNTLRAQSGRPGCQAPTTALDTCQQDRCFHRRYRTLDGACNNLQRPGMGAALTPYVRLMQPVYDDGAQASKPTVSPYGAERGRPSARELSRLLLSSPAAAASGGRNALLMQWGQFVTHDITKVALASHGECANCFQSNPATCDNIRTMPQDIRFGANQCLPMPRAVDFCLADRGSSRQQVNEITAFLDGSVVYGSNALDEARFRMGGSPFLHTSTINGRTFAPQSGSGSVFTLGDVRGNIFVGLAALHVLFVREHNRIAGQLQRLNPSWDNDRTWQETRKIVGAILQKITFDEYLPKILGPTSFQQLVGAYKGYDPSAEAAVSAAFAAGAFRFGHGMIQERYMLLGPDGGRLAPDYAFTEAVTNNQKLVQFGLDPVLRGLMAAPAKVPNRITQSVTENMFGSTDLCATNIQRGRDHGLPGYNAWRRHCGLTPAATFAQLANEVQDQTVLQALGQFYNSPDDVDLYVGGMVESAVAGGLVGPTFACIIADQFRRMRAADRFWFENPSAFTAGQRAALQSVSLAGVLCASGDNFGASPADAFTLGQQTLGCRSVGQLDLSQWRGT